jgi:hypothetical protein
MKYFKSADDFRTWLVVHGSSRSDTLSSSHDKWSNGVRIYLSNYLNKLVKLSSKTNVQLAATFLLKKGICTNIKKTLVSAKHDKKCTQ